LAIDLRRLADRLFWTVGAFAATFALRLGTNMAVSRLLAPDVLGIMVIVNSVRYGVELLTDVGVEQNIVRHRDGLTPTFLNTAWTIQIIRGFGLMLVFVALAVPLAHFYKIDPRIMLLISAAPLINSLHSTAIFGLVKRLEVRKRSLFELTCDVISAVTTITLAALIPTVWALLFGILASVAARSALSYRLPHPSHRIAIDRGYAREMLTFGKWIAVSSLVIYAAINLDRIALGRLAPLAALGVYGIARSIADVPQQLSSRLSYQLVFPALAHAQAEGLAPLTRETLARGRRLFLVIGAVVLATGIAWADVGIAILFDARYHAAGWMLSLLLVASSLSVLSTLIEALLLGFHKPAAIGIANSVRLAVLAPGLIFGYLAFGFPGAIAALIAAEAARYLWIAAAQGRIGFSFWRQDAVAMLLMALVVAFWLAIRHAAGIDWPFAAMMQAMERA
jgi:O-antigen/teichoic acid export membrane protein